MCTTCVCVSVRESSVCVYNMCVCVHGYRFFCVCVLVPNFAENDALHFFNVMIISSRAYAACYNIMYV